MCYNQLKDDRGTIAIRRVRWELELPVLTCHYLVRVGLMGRIGRFSSTDGRSYTADDHIICRTERGLETGIVVDVLRNFAGSSTDGNLLRTVTSDDRRIIERIDRFRDQAFDACRALLEEHAIPAILVDVEHLFDGQSLFFYFFGDVPDAVHEITAQLAETYEKKVRFRKFVDTLAQGCGPNCGTGESKCSSGGCGSCGVKKFCGAKN